MINRDDNDTNPMVISGNGPARTRRRGATWLQFPRRAIFLIAAWAIAIFLLRLWPAFAPVAPDVPGATGALISALALERLSSSLLLLASAVAVALAISLLLAAGGALLAWLEARSPRAGALLGALGRLAVFTWMPLPVVLSAFLLLLLLATAGTGTPFALLGDNPSTLLFSSLLLAFYPALLAAQDAVRVGVSAVRLGAGRRLLAALLQLGQSLLLQTAGVLSALTVVELIFARPGLGRLLVDSIFRRDFALTVDALSLMAVLVLLGRLAAELLGWLRRVITGDDEGSPAVSERPPRRLWTFFAALLLLLPLALVLLGLLTAPEAAVQQDLQQRLASPSLQHPLGTDALGRDVWARLRLGSMGTLSRASLLAGAVLLPALLLGLIAAALFNRGGTLWESLADLLFLPIDALLFLPLVPAAAALVALAGPGGSSTLVLVLALLFLPRAARAARDMWRWRRSGSAMRDALAALAGIFLLALFHGFVALLAVEYLGFGPPPPSPSLGLLLQESQQHLLAAPGAAAALVAILGALAFSLYTAAAAVSDFVDSRRPLVRFNE